MRNSQRIMLAALLIAATEHVDASKGGAPTGKAPMTHAQAVQKLQNFARKNNYNQRKADNLQQQMEQQNQSASTIPVQRNISETNRPAIEKASSQMTNDAIINNQPAFENLFGKEAVAAEIAKNNATSSPSYLNLAKTSAYNAGTAVGRGLYSAGKAVVDAPGYVSSKLGRRRDFITNPESGSLNSARKSFNRSLELQMNRPTKAQTAAPEQAALELSPNNNIGTAEQNPFQGKNLSEVDYASETSSVTDTNMSGSEDAPPATESAASDGSAPSSYSSLAYQAGRAVYHTPGALARMAIGEKAMAKNNYDGNVMQNAPRNLYNAAAGTPSVLYHAPGVIYRAPGKAAAYATGNQANSQNTFRRTKTESNNNENANTEISSENVIAENGDNSLADSNGNYFSSRSANSNARKRRQKEFDPMEDVL